MSDTNLTMPAGRYVAGTIEAAVRNGGYWIIRFTPRPPTPVPINTAARQESRR